MIVRLLIAAALLLLAGPAPAADPQGTWALRAGDTTIMQFKVSKTPSGWTGEWQRPSHFKSDGINFSGISGPVVRRTARSTREVVGGVEMTFDDPAPGAFPDVFVIRAHSGSTAQVSYIAFGNEPATLVRAMPGKAIGGWDKKRVYVRTVDRPTNAEMTAIFDADQSVRKHWESANWKAVEVADRGRRMRTQAILDAGMLHSGDDYYHAAFVFQHGSEPGDYLKAHALALIATARGKPSATWIAAATLDRYLQSIGQPQVYGTQFSNKDGTMRQAQPFRSDLLSDAIRTASGVPALAEQDAEYERLTKAVPVAKKP
ncbi:MAG: hypothetical protein ABIR87_03460 [Sphingomicrobium sp.]